MKTINFIRQSAAVLIIAAVAFTGCKKDDDPVKVSGVSLNKTALTFTVGGSETLEATVVPENAANKAVSWTTSDGAVATVSDAGVVTAVKAGTATITATAEDGGKTATCTVTVGPAVVQTWNCGSNVTATLYDDGVLTISGTGAMDDYSGETSPWNSLRTQIKEVIIESGVTTVGTYAFYICRSLTAISIPNSVTTIGYGAFYSCNSCRRSAV